MQTKRILISGAGIAGLSLARRCQQLDIPFKLIEKRAQIVTDGAGIALPANAMKALHHLNLYSSVKNAAHQVTEIIYTKPSGRILNRASLCEPPLSTDNFVALHRSQLHKLLVEGLEQHINFNTTITALRQNNDGVTVRLNNSEIEEEYAAVIGADGLHSSVRELTFGNIDLIDLAVTNWRWTTNYPTENLQPTYMLGAKDIFMAYPIGKDEVYCYAQVFDPEQALTNGNHSDTIGKRFSHYTGIAATLLKQLPDTSEIIPGRLRSVPHPFFSKGCVALVGDASNACSPMLQQGAACAFEDVIILSELLTHFSVKEAFKHYESYRKQRVTWIVTSSDTPMKSLANSNSFFKLLARDLFIKFKGPLNVQGWRILLATDPIAELPAYIKECKAEQKEHSHA